jgi:hypothetical protein
MRSIHAARARVLPVIDTIARRHTDLELVRELGREVPFREGWKWGISLPPRIENLHIRRDKTPTASF